MATFVIPILNPHVMLDASGDCYFERASQNFGSNDRFKHLVGVFKDTSTKVGFYGKFRVPKNYVGTAAILFEWATTAISGNAVWGFDYKAIADGESYDPASDDESLSSSAIAAPATARLRKSTSLSLTAADLAADDEVQFYLTRRGDGLDTIAASLYLFGAYFSYADV